MSATLSQLRRVVFRKWDATAKKYNVLLVLEPDDLGQDDQMTYNIAPRTKERASSLGTSTTPIAGTFDNLSASMTILMDTWNVLGKILGTWNPATYEGATAENGNIIGGAGTDFCRNDGYVSVIATGVCDDGSSADLEFSRCMPNITDDITLNGTNTTEVTLNLFPIAYNANLHSEDGYPQYTYRMGDQSLEQKMRFNFTTGDYEPVTATPAE